MHQLGSSTVSITHHLFGLWVVIGSSSRFFFVCVHDGAPHVRFWRPLDPRDVGTWRASRGYRDEVDKLKEKIRATQLALAASTADLEAVVSKVIGHLHLARF